MIDLNKFLPAYFSESTEKLVLLEEGLETLVMAMNGELLEETIRAVHSIKGSSGTFGFDDICELARKIEDILRRIEHGQISWSPGLIQLCRDGAGLLGESIQRRRDGLAPQVLMMQEMSGRLMAAVGTPPVIRKGDLES